jgi:hypothetical protein
MNRSTKGDIIIKGSLKCARILEVERGIPNVVVSYLNVKNVDLNGARGTRAQNGPMYQFLHAKKKPEK